MTRRKRDISTADALKREHRARLKQIASADIPTLAHVTGLSFMAILKTADAAGVLRGYDPAPWDAAPWPCRIVGKLTLHEVPPADARIARLFRAWQHYAADVTACDLALDQRPSMLEANAALRCLYGWALFWAAQHWDEATRAQFATQVEALNPNIDALDARIAAMIERRTGEQALN
jgi:hypothetical protein